MASSHLEKNRVTLTTLRIFFQADGSAQTSPWVLFDAEGHVLRKGEDDLQHMPLADQTDIVVPAEWVSLIPAKLPAGNRKRIQEALPYLVEDHLIASPEQMHVVIAVQLNATDAILASIDKQQLKKLLADVQASHIDLQRVIPATLIPPFHDNTWVVVYDAQTSFLRTGLNSGFALEIESLAEAPIALSLAIEQAKSALQSPNEIVVYGRQAKDLSPHLANWSKQLGVNISLNNDDWKTAPPSEGMNFLQGAFAVSHGAWAWVQQAKPGFILLIGILAVSIIGSSIDWARHATEKRQLDSQMVSLFKRTFPEAGNVVNAPLQMQRKLAELQHATGDADSADFLPLLARISTEVGNLSQVNAMDYLDGKLILAMQASDAPTAQAIAQKLISSGHVAIIEDFKPNAQGVTFNLVFKASGS